ncbi:MAG: hypothetical protein H7839_22470 [Magnetococcus sp. YQC-5]
MMHQFVFLLWTMMAQLFSPRHDAEIRLLKAQIRILQFFSKEIFTPMGKMTGCVLVFIHLGSRRVYCSAPTWPTGFGCDPLLQAQQLPT